MLSNSTPSRSLQLSPWPPRRLLQVATVVLVVSTRLEVSVDRWPEFRRNSRPLGHGPHSTFVSYRHAADADAATQRNSTNTRGVSRVSDSVLALPAVPQQT